MTSPNGAGVARPGWGTVTINRKHRILNTLRPNCPDRSILVSTTIPRSPDLFPYILAKPMGCVLRGLQSLPVDCPRFLTLNELAFPVTMLSLVNALL